MREQLDIERERSRLLLGKLIGEETFEPDSKVDKKEKQVVDTRKMPWQRKAQILSIHKTRESALKNRVKNEAD